MSMFDLTGTTALITGASGGIGLALVQGFLEAGANVVAADLNPQTVDNARSGNGRVLPITLDVLDLDGIRTVLATARNRFGPIDVLVNNAGGLGGRQRFEEMTTEFYRFVMALNLDSTFFASRAAIPFLKKGDLPTIINYTSNAGWNAGGPGAGIYGTSKAGVHAITRALAKDLAEYNIRVNAVSPGTIDTPFHAQIKSTKPEVFASWKNNIMLGRLGQPQEVASVVSFLASNDAAFITAETIQIGGGQALGI